MRRCWNSSKEDAGVFVVYVYANHRQRAAVLRALAAMNSTLTTHAKI